MGEKNEKSNFGWWLRRMACGDLRWIAGIHNVRVGSLEVCFFGSSSQHPQSNNTIHRGLTLYSILVLYSTNISAQSHIPSIISSKLEIEIDCVSNLFNLHTTKTHQNTSQDVCRRPRSYCSQDRCSQTCFIRHANPKHGPLF